MGTRDPRVDAYLEPLPDWQRETLQRVREVLHRADPAMTETIKRAVQPYFVLEGNVAAFLAARDHVNVFVYDGGIVPDPTGLITAGHHNTTARTIGFREGDAVFVSGAAGAVGSLVGQFARLRGASRVVGSAGSPAKVQWLTGELGFDAAFDYHDGRVADLLATAAPGGLDVFFDNVGGEHLEAALGALHVHGRVAICGAISQYNAIEPPPGPRNFGGLMVSKRLRVEGFLVGDHTDLRPQFAETVAGWLRSGELVVRETVREGLDQAVPAFLDLLRGGNTGKMVVRLAPDPD